MQGSEGLIELVAACGPITKEDLAAVDLNIRRKFVYNTYQCYQELERLNPELSVLTPRIETHVQRWDVVNGILSKFNVADIARFSIDGIKGMEAHKDPAWVARQEKIESTIGKTYWIPAPSTQMLILQKAQERDKSAGISR